MLTAKQFLDSRQKKTNNNKYKAKKCSFNNLSFPSLLERDCYAYLKTQQDCGIIKYIIRQVPFDLPGNSTHKIDFMAVIDTGNIFLEAKGRDLPMGKLKRKQVEELYSITVQVITKVADIYGILS